MALIRNIVKSILPPEDTAEMWLDVFNIDVTTSAGAAKVLCFDVSTGAQVTFKQQS